VTTGRPFQILSLDGGGYRGLFSAAVLAAFEEDLGQPVVEHFDLVTGTSTGGIIALALGAGRSPREVIEFYETHGPRVFARSRLRRLKHPFRAKYPPGPLREALDTVFADLTLADSRVRLVIPSYSLTDDTVYLFKTAHNEKLRRDWKVPMTDVAMATSVAPTYFPSFEFDHQRLVDGGVWANNPTVVGIAEAVSMCGASLDRIRVFSLGTTSDLKARDRRLSRGGLVNWARAGSDVLLRGQSIAACNTAIHLIGEERLLRVDPVVPPRLLRLDGVNPDELIGRARAESRRCLPRFCEVFGHHRAPPFVPFYPLPAVS
jgi:patatin-like phospholipase/acyl hydrolase